MEKENKKPKIKELTVHQVETLLKKETLKEGYAKLSFGEPRMGRDVDIDFKIHDKTDRTEYDSKKKLKKLLTKTLEWTNWKLMSDGINYRLGILTGRLKTLEKEQDFMFDVNGNKILL